MNSTALNNNKRIAKNSLMLYIRMVLMTLILFYTSRVMLKAMGVEDYGVYNIVGGIVVLFSFLNNTMTSSIQRFLNYLLGKNDLESVKKVFVQGVVISFVFTVIFFLLSETLGLYYIKEVLNVPAERAKVSLIVYQLSVLSAIFMILRIPYVASVISYEKMGAYAVISIIDTLLKLVIVGLLFVVPYDRLITYSILLCIVNFSTTILYVAYSKKKLNIISHKLYIDTCLLRRLLSFTGWSLLGSSSSVVSTQGIGIILNFFYGVVANAAIGIANQVLSGLYNIAASFTNAFNPVLVKSYAEGDAPYYTNLLNKSSRLTFCLMWIVCLPLIVWCEELLDFWLGEVPRYSVEFCRLMILYSLIEGVSAPFWMMAQAEGNIKYYQIVISSLTILSLLLGYVLLVFFNDPTMILLARLVVSLIIYIYRILYIKGKIAFSLWTFCLECVNPVIKMVIVSSSLLYLLYVITVSRVQSFIIGIVVTVIVVLFLGFSKEERHRIITLLKTRIGVYG